MVVNPRVEVMVEPPLVMTVTIGEVVMAERVSVTVAVPVALVTMVVSVTVLAPASGRTGQYDLQFSRLMSAYLLQNQRQRQRHRLRQKLQLQRLRGSLARYQVG